MRRSNLRAAALLLGLAGPSAAQETAAAMVDGDGVVLRGLDKMSSRVTEFTMGVGQTAAFERLEIRLDACIYEDGDIGGEGVALLTIRDIREEAPRFQGWMFASSPALSALDHPRYDIWVISCTKS
jgi:hypothetical protein